MTSPLMQHNDKSGAELMRLAKTDPDMFGVLMERYERPLFRYIRRVSQLPTEDVEDILQEVFIKIYRKLNEYPEVIKFSSWAYRIAHNHIVDHFRRLGARPRTNSLKDDEWLKIVASQVNLENEVMHKDCAQKIKACIQDLPLKYQEVLVLRFLEEKEYEEIMDILQKPKGSVSTLINRGKKLLKQRMKRQNIDCH